MAAPARVRRCQGLGSVGDPARVTHNRATSGVSAPIRFEPSRLRGARSGFTTTALQPSCPGQRYETNSFAFHHSYRSGQQRANVVILGPGPEAHSLRGFPYEAYRQLMAAQHSIDETEGMGLDPVEREPEDYKPMTAGEWLLVLGGIIVVVGFWTVVWLLLSR